MLHATQACKFSNRRICQQGQKGCVLDSRRRLSGYTKEPKLSDGPSFKMEITNLLSLFNMDQNQACVSTPQLYTREEKQRSNSAQIFNKQHCLMWLVSEHPSALQGQENHWTVRHAHSFFPSKASTPLLPTASRPPMLVKEAGEGRKGARVHGRRSLKHALSPPVSSGLEVLATEETSRETQEFNATHKSSSPGCKPRRLRISYVT